MARPTSLPWLVTTLRLATVFPLANILFFPKSRLGLGKRNTEYKTFFPAVSHSSFPAPEFFSERFQLRLDSDFRWYTVLDLFQ